MKLETGAATSERTSKVFQTCKRHARQHKVSVSKLVIISGVKCSLKSSYVVPPRPSELRTATYLHLSFDDETQIDDVYWSTDPKPAPDDDSDSGADSGSDTARSSDSTSEPRRLSVPTAGIVETVIWPAPTSLDAELVMAEDDIASDREDGGTALSPTPTVVEKKTVAPKSLTKKPANRK